MIAWLVDTAIALTVLMALVLVAREPVARLFGAGWAYALWLLPLGRILLPPLELPALDVFPAIQPLVILVPDAAGGGGLAAVPAAAEAGISWLQLLLGLWLGGIAMFALWQQSAYSAFMLSLGEAPTPAVPPAHGSIPVVQSGAVDGPIAVGFLQRRIVVPLDFANRYSPAERRHALDHELVHHRRGDLWWNLAALVLLGLNWFNPIAWLAYRAFRSDQELACDAAVAAHMAVAGRHDYARALVKSATRAGQVAACPLNRADQLKRRLKMMKQHRASRARNIGGGAAVAALVGAGLVVAGPGFARTGAPAPADMIVQPEAAVDPIINEKDMATLRDRCTGGGGAELLPRWGLNVNAGGSAIVCDSDLAARDPEVRAIMEKTHRGVQARIEVAAEHTRHAGKAIAVNVEHTEAAEPVAAARSAVAHVQVPPVDHDAIRSRVKQALRALPRQTVVVAMPPQGAVIAFDHGIYAATYAEDERESIEAITDAHADLAEAQAEVGSHRAKGRIAADIERSLARAQRQHERQMRALERRLNRQMRTLDVQIERDVELKFDHADVDSVG